MMSTTDFSRRDAVKTAEPQAASESAKTGIAALWRPALVQAFVKLDPRQLKRSPVMLVVELTAILTTVLCVIPNPQVPTSVCVQIALWLWFTVLFANFAEALAEGRGKARADSLKAGSEGLKARIRDENGSLRTINASELRKGDVVRVDAGEMIPGDGEVIEYTLKMKQFSQDGLLSTLQANGEVTTAHIDELARQIAGFHLSSPQVGTESELGSPDSVMAPVVQNFEQIRPLISEKSDLAQLEALQAWAESSFARLKPLLAQRKADGFIHECHGDIHLGNATVIDGKVVLFDCIEFNEPFRKTDVYADIGFLAMDLEDRGLKSLSRRLISQYLEVTGDYAGLELLNFYKAYRAMVRAKVALFSQPSDADGVQRAATLRQYRNYANLAESYSAIPSPFLTITHGVSAVGKSHVAMRLVESLGAIRLRSDIERKRLFAGRDEEMYGAQANDATYAHLHELAGITLRAGFSVVIDATYLKHGQRDAAAKVAENTGVPFMILDCEAPQAVIAGWLAQRQAQNNDPSDATLEVIEAQQANRELLSAEETLRSKKVATHISSELDSLIDNLRQRLPGL
ncbi:Uma3 [Pseudomonas amygdali pv. eriobotryae]|uniref:Uma3 n=2 Tax=Pseudomonas amygdali TaxID=47877 RepID=A0A3M3AB58_PSEA0|nr:Uma3 [Pseudomonas amygdali pv. eriobotryae]